MSRPPRGPRLSLPLPPSYERRLGHARRVELSTDRTIRARNKVSYRLAHWPIWIFVFFIAPGPLTFDLFERGFDARLLTWLGVVLAGTGIAGLRGRLPGVEPAPYIIRFTEDRPNPFYRRVCYTLAWSEIITFALLNAAGLAYALASGEWRLRQMYEAAYFPIAGSIWLAVWAIVDASRLISDQAVPPFDRWIAAAVIAGVGQVLFGSLAYLIPVLLGPGPRLTRNFERMDSHRWLPLAALNGAAVALIADVPTVTLILLAVWLVDLLRRLVTLERTETATP